MPGSCLVTGASYGLGAEISRQLGAAGWELVLVARSADRLQALASHIEAGGGKALALSCDITDKAAVAELEKKVEEKFPGGPDIVINNAAYVPPIHTFAGGEISQWERAIAVNVWGALLVTRSDSEPSEPC